MKHNLTIELVDIEDNVITKETISNVRSNWKATIQSEVSRVEASNMSIGGGNDWKKINIIVEKV